MSTKTGLAAEAAAADFLKKQQLKVVARNWRTRWCEIDIIAQSATTIYFVEVKYRQNSRYGAGLDYITTQKQRQMHFAADFWLSKNRSNHYQYRLAAIEVSGPDFSISAWIDDIG